MKFIDLTHPLVHGLPAFPNDPKLSIVPHSTVAMTKYNISQIVMGSHQGTHVDAMFHFIETGRTLDQMPLEWFHGRAHLLHIPKKAGEDIRVEDFLPYEHLLVPEAKILFETGWHRHFGRQEFFENFPSLTQDAARFLAEKRIRLLGMDTPTPGRDWYEVHHILLGAEIVVVESLANLDHAPSSFTFMGFPLLFHGGDGSPIRAVALID